MKKEIFKIEKNKNKKYKKYSIIERTTLDCALNPEFQNLIREIGEKRVSHVFLNIPVDEKIILQNFKYFNLYPNPNSNLKKEKELFTNDSSSSNVTFSNAAKFKPSDEFRLDVQCEQFLSDEGKIGITNPDALLNALSKSTFENINKITQGSEYNNSTSHVLVIPNFLNDRCTNNLKDINNYSNNNFFNEDFYYKNSSINNKNEINISDFDEDLYFSF